MKKTILLLSLILMASVPVLAQGDGAAQTALSPEVRVDQLMAPYSGDAVPGGLVGVVKDGEMIFAKGYGMANLTYNIPFTTDVLNNIGSTSKQFTAFAIMLLQEQGALSLDDDIRKHIPELPDFGQTVTLRHLLTHTSGYREFFNTLSMNGRLINDYIGPKEITGVLLHQPELQNIPGAEWNYNNTGYALLAMVIKKTSGMEFPEWMRKNVFEPLGMNHTYVRENPGAIIPNSAMGYMPAADGSYAEIRDLSASQGAGGIYTTLGDLAKWAANFDAYTLGNAAIFTSMTTPYVLNDGSPTNYGLGLFIDEYKGMNRVHHGGADMAHRSYFMYFPEHKGAVIVQSNNAGFNGDIANKVAEVFFGEYMALDSDGNETADVSEATDEFVYNKDKFAEVEGDYELEIAPGFILSFFMEDDKLYTQATGQQKIEIIATSDSTFRLTLVEAAVTFHRDAEGKVNALTLHQNGNHKAKRVLEEPWKPTESDITAYSGSYFSSELQAFYTVEQSGDELVLKHRRMQDLPLQAIEKDKFASIFPITEVTFVRDAQGSVTGFLASNGRARGILFEKQ